MRETSLGSGRDYMRYREPVPGRRLAIHDLNPNGSSGTSQDKIRPISSPFHLKDGESALKSEGGFILSSVWNLARVNGTTILHVQYSVNDNQAIHIEIHTVWIGHVPPQGSRDILTVTR